MRLIPVLVACTNPPKFTEAAFSNLRVTLVVCFSSKRYPHHATIKTNFTEEIQPMFFNHHQTMHTESEYKLVTNKIVDFEVCCPIAFIDVCRIQFFVQLRLFSPFRWYLSI